MSDYILALQYMAQYVRDYSRAKGQPQYRVWQHAKAKQNYIDRKLRGE